MTGSLQVWSAWLRKAHRPGSYFVTGLTLTGLQARFTAGRNNKLHLVSSSRRKPEDMWNQQQPSTHTEEGLLVLPAVAQGMTSKTPRRSFLVLRLSINVHQKTNEVCSHSTEEWSKQEWFTPTCDGRHSVRLGKIHKCVRTPVHVKTDNFKQPLSLQESNSKSGLFCPALSAYGIQSTLTA